MQERSDVVVAGGGIVGLATALALCEDHHKSVLLLEAEPEVARHQSGHNSGVIHAGLYYRPDSLKAQLCVAGREALYRFCEQEGVAHLRTGKLVVATADGELPRLHALHERGVANGLSGLRRVSRAEIREIEPHCTGLAGLWVEETGVVDFAAVTAAIAERARSLGLTVLTSCRVRRAVADGGAVVVESDRGAFRASGFVNCCGLHADRVAVACGVEPGVRIVPFRGEYYELIPERRHLVRHPIYPVPDPALPFLGVHLTPTAGGKVEAGPNAVLAFRRDGYRLTDVSLRDIGEYLAYPGFWRMAAQHWRAGLTELRRSASRSAFAAALRKLVPEIGVGDLRYARAGVRAQAIAPDGRLVDDFHLVTGPRSVHVLNAPSPAATASLAIGRFIAQRTVETMGA